MRLGGCSRSGRLDPSREGAYPCPRFLQKYDTRARIGSERPAEPSPFGFSHACFDAGCPPMRTTLSSTSAEAVPVYVLKRASTLFCSDSRLRMCPLGAADSMVPLSPSRRAWLFPHAGYPGTPPERPRPQAAELFPSVGSLCAGVAQGAVVMRRAASAVWQAYDAHKIQRGIRRVKCCRNRLQSPDDFCCANPALCVD